MRPAPMRTPLQEQLLKAGLVKKNKVAEAAREQNRKRHGKTAPAEAGDQAEARRLQAERAERDRALAAERNAIARAGELRAQIRQIVDCHKLARDGDAVYRFTDGDAIRSLLISEAQRPQLAKGALVIVRHDQGFELIPRAAADKVYARDAGMIVLDHARSPVSEPGEDDDYYQRFQVPDDLIW
jgi:uncharacterized protein